MGKKSKLYLVILINLAAWGYVGYKVYTALQGDDDIELSHDTTEIKKIDEVKKDDTVLLSLNYPDPFLKGGNFSKENRSSYNSQSTNSNGNALHVKTVIVQSVKPVVAPIPMDIKYVGMVKNSDKGTQTAMMSFNGKSFFVKQNDVIEGYSIQEITRDQVKLKKGKEVLFITK